MAGQAIPWPARPSYGRPGRSMAGQAIPGRPIADQAVLLPARPWVWPDTRPSRDRRIEGAFQGAHPGCDGGGLRGPAGATAAHGCS